MKTMFKIPSATAATMLLMAGVTLMMAVPEAVNGQTRFLRQPSVSAAEIAFVHANDIWVVGRDGGDARRLTSADGAETEPSSDSSRKPRSEPSSNTRTSCPSTRSASFPTGGTTSR